MPTIFIDGRPIEADSRQTVIEAALANGIEIPHFCWHPQLSIAGNCRICVVQVEGRSWVEIACNMPVTEGLRVLTASDLVRDHRKAMLELVTLNPPVDCGVCDKSGECRLQDYHYAYNGAPSVSRDAKVKATKFHPLSERIVLDNERCVLCSRCVRFTREVSKSNALGIVERGDASLVRESADRALDADAYSDNIIDLCPVGALLSRDFLYKSRVWYLEPTPSICPGCARGCTVQIWHRKVDWKLHALDPRRNACIERVTPLDNPAVNGPWICNKGRDLAKILERPRARHAMARGATVGLDEAIAAARRLIESARRPVALVSSWGSNEELHGFRDAFAGRVDAYVKSDHAPAAGEVLQDDILVRADKNPNSAGALALFPALATAPDALDQGDVLLVWGEGFDLARAPAQARTIVLGSFEHAQNARADVFIPVSIQTERRGHYTNFQGTVSAFSPCFEKAATIIDAEALFARLATRTAVPA